jgi:hypothetical protein
MVWVKLDDGFPEHPKMHAAGALGLAMQVAALCYCNRNLTDGFIPTAAAKKLVDLDDIRGVAWKGVVKRLVDVGAWREVPGGWQIHDYAEYQPTRAQIQDDRKAARERMQTVRANRSRTSTERTAERSPELRRSSPYPGPVPDVPAERSRARTRDPTPKPPVFNGDAHVARLEREKSDPDTARAEMTRIRKQLNPSEGGES